MTPFKKHVKALPTLLLTILMVSLAVTRANAQRSGDQPEPSMLRFLFVDEAPGAYFMRMDDGSFKRLSAKPYVVSQPIKVPGDTDIDIYRELPDPMAPGTLKKTKIVTTHTTTEGRNGLIVIRPTNKRNPETNIPIFDAHFFDSSEDKFPPKSLRILNLNSGPVAIQLGKEKALVEPNDTMVLQPETDNRNRVFYKIASRNKGSWEMLYDSMMVVRPTERITGIFVYSPSGMKHTYTEGELIEFGDPEPGNFWLTYSE